MKTKLFLFILITASIFITGCLHGYPYSYVGENPQNYAIIKFDNNDGVLFVDFEGKAPEVPEKSYLYSIFVPAGRQMDFRVYVYWNGPGEGYRRRGIFKCPPLEAGGEYRLRFNTKTKGVFIKLPVDGYSIVLERKIERKGLLFGPRYEGVYTQAIPAWPKQTP